MALTISREDCIQYVGIAVLTNGVSDMTEPTRFLIGLAFSIARLAVIALGAHEQIKARVFGLPSDRK